MIIDPLKQVNKHVDVDKLNNRMDKIVNEITEYLIEEYSNVIGTIGFGEKKVRWGEDGENSGRKHSQKQMTPTYTEHQKQGGYQHD